MKWKNWVNLKTTVHIPNKITLYFLKKHDIFVEPPCLIIKKTIKHQMLKLHLILKNAQKLY